MLEAQPWIWERRAQVKVIAEREHELRKRGLDEVRRFTRPQIEGALQEWARVLEVSLLLASIQESANRLGLATAADVARNVESIDKLVATLSRLDIERVMRENPDTFEPLAKVQPHADSPASADMGLVVNAIQSLLVHCPIAQLERASRDHSFPEVGHRCRLAFDGLRAFIARNTHPSQAAIVAAGTAYAEGRLSIDEVAIMLSIDVPDAVALLEEQGFRRLPDELRLTDEERQARLKRIRDERLARGGEPVADERHVIRDVIASQRIEDVDARPWLRT